MTTDTRMGDRGVFDRFFAWVETLRRVGKYSYGLEEHIAALERLIQDVDDPAIGRAANTRLSFWLDSAGRDPDPRTVTGLQCQLRELLHVVSRWTSTSVGTEVVSQIELLEPIPPPDYRPGSSPFASMNDVVTFYLTRGLAGQSTNLVYEIADLSRALAEDTGDALRQHVLRCLAGEVSAARHAPIPAAMYQWDITVTYLADAPRASTYGYLIWALGSGLESIPGVDVFLDATGPGSWWARLKINMRTIWARDDVQEVLSQTRKGLQAQYVEKPHGEAELLKEQRNKLEEERKTLATQRELLPSTQEESAKRELELRGNELTLRQREVEIRAKELDNAIRALEVVEKVSSLIRSGIVKADPVQLDVNGLLYAILREGRYEEGRSIGELTSRQAVATEILELPAGAEPQGGPKSENR